MRNGAFRICPVLLGTAFFMLLSVAVAVAGADPLEQSTAEERSTPLFSAAGPGSGARNDLAGRSEETGLGFLRGILDQTKDEDGFLPVDAAFRLSVSAYDPERLLASWRIEPGHYLYRDRIEVELAEGAPEDASLVGVDLPPGDVRDDPYFGPVRIYRTEAGAAIQVAHAGSPPATLDLAVTYQGCADAGLCYPPERKIVPVFLTDSGSAETGASAAPMARLGYRRGANDPAGGPDAELSDADRIALTLAADRLFIALAVFFGFGQAGDPLRGGLALFALGLGMGAPLLVLGASAGRLLPKAGRWVVAVQPAILFFAPDRTERRRYRLFGLEDAREFSLRVKGATDAA